jgi:N-acylglucosamine 2-epimerase
MVDSLQPYAARYRRHLLDAVLPFWLNTLDREHGGYFNCAGRDGAVYDPRKHVWMQGRGVWTFARLYNTLEKRQEWLDAAACIQGFLRKHARAGEPRCWFSLTRRGDPVYFQRKPYSAFFVALADIEWHKATGDRESLAEAVELFGNIREWIRNPRLLGRPPAGPPMSQLADIMVEASLALELAAVCGEPLYHEVMRGCLEAVKAHWDPERRLLMENVAPRELPEGRLFCPGSALEVAWFLLHVLRLHPDREIERLCLDAIEGALHFGWDREHGGLYYFMDADGRPPAQLEWHMKLWWPHTEALYALVLAATRTGERRWLDWLERVDSYTFARFPDSAYGEWFGYLDRAGYPTHDLKGAAYKGCFHVPRCLLFSIQAIGEHA